MRLDVDPSTALAHAMVKRPGAYAVLLGSGVSRSAQIPTGWEVTLELARELAIAEGANDVVDIEKWYKDQFGKEPNYSDIVETLAPTRAEQRRLLSTFFEPLDEYARERGERTPSAAHRAIARLISKEFIRVVLTTNFDRLLEDALIEEGIHPTVIKSIDDINGMEPLGRSKCLLVKLHGDYQDTRIRNSEKDLSEYEPEWNSLIDRIIDEYGIMACGWSGESDYALCDAFKRAPNRRYTTFWSTLGEPKTAAQDIITARGAEVSKGKSADDFFGDLESKVDALSSIGMPSPLTVATAEAEIKRYLSDPKAHAIRLHDLLLSEAKAAHNRLPKTWSELTGTLSEESVRAVTAQTESSYEVFLTMLAQGSYHGVSEQLRPWIESVLLSSSLIRSPRYEGFNPDHYPAVLTLYSIGPPALASNNFELLKAVSELTIQSPNDKSKSIIELGRPWTWMTIDFAKRFKLNDENQRTPGSDHLLNRLLPVYRRLVPDDHRWEQLFDDWEVLLGLLQADIFIRTKSFRTPHLGRFVWRAEWDDNDWESKLNDPTSYLPLREGLFGGSSSRFEASRERLVATVERFGFEISR